jgi:CDGSH-type Zn-finger protein
MSEDSKSPPNAARITAYGPLILHGRIRYSAQAGAPAAEYTRVALCRCGGSGSKPFCDGTHARIGFADAGGCARPPEQVSHAAEGDVVLNPIANGPLRIDGWFELAAADGARYVCGEKTWMCRCGHSATKPFCDGTHKKIGFSG